MSITHVALTAALIGVLTIAPGAAAQGQPPSPLQAGIALYAAAAYDDALTAFDTARQIDLALDDRVALDQHRMLCLLALGRTAAADEAAASLLQTKPDFVLTASDASPRARAMFDQTRRRVLPAVVRRVYTDARRAYDGGDFAAARDGFTQLSHMLADPEVAAADPAFADLGTLSDGFLQLSAAAINRRSAQRDYDTVQAALAVLEPAPPRAPLAFAGAANMAAPAFDARVDGASEAAVIVEPVATPETAEPAPVTEASAPVASSAVVSPPFAPLGIFTYDWRDKDVAPPVPINQAISGYWGSMGEPPAGTPLGAIDVVVNEAGRVIDAQIYKSVNRFFDLALLESVKQWRYEPARKDGRPVKYRRVTALVSGR